ncbi:MAG: hypothetical protein KAT43_03320 [Nanoarchaeota archaeon]|nr:hypothetical protein [Nanoarchaeota archaeon]
MGFLDALKGMFKAKGELVEIPLEQLESWFDGKTKHKFSARDQTISALYDQFDTKIKEAADKIVALEEAELHNKNLPPRMLAYMVGNRNNYIKQVRMLIDNIPKFGKDFPDKFQKVLEDFAKKTQKSYVILQEFFANETKDLAQTVGALDRLSRQIVGTTLKEDLMEIENINMDIAKIHEKQKEQESLKNKINDTQNEINAKQKEYTKTKERIAKRKESKAYADLMILKELAEEQKSQAEKLDKGIIEMFAPLARAFRKYKRITVDHEKLIEKYLDDPIKGLMGDSRLRIISAIGGVENNIDKLGFEKKEKKKISDKLAAITKEKLQELYDLYSKLRALVSDTQEKLDEYRIIEELTQLEMDLDAIQNNINRLNGTIDTDIKKITELDTDIEHLVNGVTDKVKSLLYIHLKIKIKPQELNIEKTVQV